MKRYKFTTEYFGGAFCGWQRQKNGVSVQETVEQALSHLVGAQVSVTGSSRTDAGVHALAQVFHVDLETNIPAEKIPYALNTELPDTVKVTSCEVVADDFHARYDTKRKSYIYKMYLSPFLSPTRAHTHLWVVPPVDVEKMKAALPALLGEHDFKCFLASGSAVKNTVRTIFDATLTSVGDELIFRIEGSGFLYNMVRIIVGTLLYIGVGKLNPDDMERIIALGDRKQAGKTVPPEGLYLEKIIY